MQHWKHPRCKQTLKKKKKSLFIASKEHSLHETLILAFKKDKCLGQQGKYEDISLIFSYLSWLSLMNSRGENIISAQEQKNTNQRGFQTGWLE